MPLSRKSGIPWQVKVAAKLVLSAIPLRYGMWRRLGLFRHGKMDRPKYGYEVFKCHFERAGVSRRNTGFTQLELGPGDSLCSAMIGYAFGASATYLVDVGSYAQDDLGFYHSMAGFLSQEGLEAPDLSHARCLNDLLAVCGAQYLTQGLASLRTIPDQSIHFIWSHAVLQSVRRSEFVDTLKELRRIIRSDGVCSHQIDLRDFLGGNLNSLRFRKELWESDFMIRSRFYTNRIRYSEMLRLFEQTGFDVHVSDASRWDTLPISRAKLSPEFRCLSDGELCVSGFGVVLRPR